MAKAKKSTVSKKKSVIKKSTPAKKAVVKKTVTNKVTKKSAPAKKAVAKKVDKKTTKSSVSSKAKEVNNTWQIVAIVLAVVLVLLAAVAGFMYFGNNESSDDSSDTTNVNVDDTNKVQADSVKLLIIEDPSCTSCEVDLFVSQVKENLISDLVATKVDFNSAEGQEVVNTLSLTQVPAYLFSAEIASRDDWEEQLQGAFIETSIQGVKFYMLNPQFIPNKVMTVEPPITDNAVVIGDVNAPVTIIQFTDFECPFCAIADGNKEMVEEFKMRDPSYVAPMPEVYKNYVESGQVKVVFYNFPIASLHPQSEGAHMAVMCANEQGNFKVYAETLWDKRTDWIESSDRDSTYKSYAVTLGLDEAQFNECLDTDKYKSQITSELALGQSLGVSGTPAFFVGKTFISGAQSYQVFKDLIDVQLALN